LSEAGRALRQAAALAGLSVLVAAALHVPLVGRFLRGEFRQSFFQAGEGQGIRMITLGEAEDLWRTGQAVLWDARAAEIYGRGHVPGARNAPAAGAKDALPAAVLETPRDRTCLVYCEGGGCLSSLALSRRLHDAGFRDVRVFAGGWEEWTAAGLPVEEDRDRAPEGAGGR